MNTLDKVKKMKPEDIIQKLVSAGLKDYGVHREKLSEKLDAAMAESHKTGNSMKLVAALDNSDTSGVLLDILKENPVKIMEGLSIIAYSLNIKDKIICIPEYAEAYVSELQATANTYGIDINLGLVDHRHYKGSLIIHLITAGEIVEYLNNEYSCGVYVSVNGQQLRKVLPDIKISDLLSGVEEIKALRLGGRIYKPDALNLTVEQANITNGVIQSFTHNDCMICETEKLLSASRQQSCGRCVFCREGLIQLQNMHKDITEGKGKLDYIPIINEIGDAMAYSTNCSLGQTSSDIALSVLNNFNEEYETHIKKKICQANVCTALTGIYIDPEICQGCGDCMDICPTDCIAGKSGYIHMIDEFDCTKCGRCIEVCEAGAIKKSVGKLPKLPDRLTKCGRFKKR
ncbi:NADH-ubiquinone oxidoreductase-F iron-sulfur binding region domain-containing protein [Anaerocolumna sp. MB42-C2]|uniref:NADH-ubiquinone oxidoreductase-F iron-sulfur binding region domain-containing protein n=1 Tax=Anaerocolumna sp. MB42-C2 TaxID=3070997 RepID=UPI0027DECF27|nr:NADH-ubiquinone oxidoreductase-F iron-sulfur binding region domain-containing protein [Anaerocolumna sp. MB42-C2]WMJ90113.1 NADH-ubiquinone oxidoreductase-F iron-sulfur binding region domain-containing protein [Anaerocolumna sp. MB42-C2]